MVSEASSEYESQWRRLRRSRIGCTPETLRRWVRQQERDTGQRPGPTTAEEERIKALDTPRSSETLSCVAHVPSVTTC